MTPPEFKWRNTQRVSIAPMMGLTDRHCRYFHRLLTRNTWLYTEMISADAVYYGRADQQLRALATHPVEIPVVIQLGGSHPKVLAYAAQLAQRFHYQAINLNCGCPSPRVQRGVFGACLMAYPSKVAHCIKAMRDACSLPISVKHRIGIDGHDSFEFVRDFVGIVAQVGCRTFVIHARKALLKGLSPKDNRTIPPLIPDYVYRLKREFPHLEIILNGGIHSLAQIDHHLLHVDGVMLGRAAYDNPGLLSEFDLRYFGAPTSIQLEIVEEQMIVYLQNEVRRGIRPQAILRHMMGLYRASPAARSWRRYLCEEVQTLAQVINIKRKKDFVNTSLSEYEKQTI